MFNLYQIVSGAQGGQALDNLAQQFGISRTQADSTVRALVPALSTAFMAKAGQPGGLQELAAALTDSQHAQAFADPSTAQAPDTQRKGGEIVTSIFGNNAIVQQIVQNVATFTGVPAATIEQMLPVVVSIVLGGVASAMRNQNLDGILGELAGGLGGLFGPAGGVPGQAGTGGFGGMFENILGSVLGGSAPAQTPPAPAGTQAGASSGEPPSSGLPPAFQAGMEALGKMFQPGVTSHAGLPTDLGDQISSILGGKRN